MPRAGRDLYGAEELQEKEAEFFDSIAASRPLDLSRTIDRDTNFPYVTPAGSRHLNRFYGSLEGKRVLDVGCGAGFSTVLLAKKGALVTAFDVSERYLEMARERIRINGVEDRIEWIGKMGAEKLRLPDDSFDAVYGGHVLHHTKLECSVPEIARVMNSGARGAFVETLGTNPVFTFVRSHVAGHFGIPRLSNETEYPLRSKELKFVADHFRTCNLRGDILFGMAYEYLFKSPRVGRILRSLDGAMFDTFPWTAKGAYCGILTLVK
jgi:ubiquinone/menaquinone biosynthesis C-methylase UbiE